ncbi:MAG: 2-amino-4-hydroxy-6-hydroxymethyldihydropteridine diphosphokinase [Deltaproteobacteria bacterium]|nr:2-amino-4-hydroxy-6-hydroxymethyldihydropteridine diphosphokinase [Deltaproteobacteria bacterium]
MKDRVFIGIGSNVGDSQGACIKSIRELIKDGRLRLQGFSSLYRTTPVSEIPQDDFVNCAVFVSWAGSPLSLLEFLMGIENRMGRVRDGKKDSPRVIDLDILLFGNLVLHEHSLIIPHAELHKRKFAMVPCLEIDPQIIHPALRRPLATFVSKLEEAQSVERIRKIGKDEIGLST